MALYAFDGTWNSKKTEDTYEKNTNVRKFYDAHLGQSNYYLEDVGTRFGIFGKIFGGIAGLGGRKRIREAYKKLCENYARGETDIDIVGFSRGAAMALHFANTIQRKGIKDPKSKKKLKKKPEVRFLGLWDVVASFGIPFNLGIPFHRINLGWRLKLPKNTRHCFHALALDERRQTFRPTRVHGGYEVWFRGVHSDVGGGNGNEQLNNIALRWMLKKAHEAELPVDPSSFPSDSDIDPSADIKEPEDVFKNKLRKPHREDRFHYTVDVRPGRRHVNPTSDTPRETLTSEGQIGGGI